MNEQRKEKPRRFPWLAITALVAVGLAGVGIVASLPLLRPDLPTVDAASVNWTSYSHEGMGIALEVPDAFDIEEEPYGVRMYYDGSPLVMISCISETAADDRGLWGGREPTGDTELGGVAGKNYVYDHFDALAGVHTIAHVIPYRDKFLALEFRTRRISVFEELGLVRVAEDRQLNEAELRMFSSFRIESD